MVNWESSSGVKSVKPGGGGNCHKEHHFGPGRKSHCPSTQREAEELGFHNSCHFPLLVPLTSSRASSFPVSLSGKKTSGSFRSNSSGPRLSTALGTGRSCWELRDPETGLPHTARPLPPRQGHCPGLLPSATPLPPMNHPHHCCCCSRTAECQAAPHLWDRQPIRMRVEAGRLSPSKERRDSSALGPEDHSQRFSASTGESSRGQVRAELGS